MTDEPATVRETRVAILVENMVGWVEGLGRLGMMFWMAILAFCW